MSKRDVIVSRGIWYLMTLLSIFGLSISLNLLWPPGTSRFHRDIAVSATTFYAVTLLRYIFFTDPPSTCYKEFNTKTEKFPQLLFSQLSFSATAGLPLCLAGTEVYLLPATFFTVSLFTGGVGLIQLSDKLRMETRHAYLTLFLVWLFCPFWTYLVLYTEELSILTIYYLPVYQVFYYIVLFRISFPDADWKDYFIENLSLPT